MKARRQSQAAAFAGNGGGGEGMCELCVVNRLRRCVGRADHARRLAVELDVAGMPGGRQSAGG